MATVGFGETAAQVAATSAAKVKISLPSVQRPSVVGARVRRPSVVGAGLQRPNVVRAKVQRPNVAGARVRCQSVVVGQHQCPPCAVGHQTAPTTEVTEQAQRAHLTYPPTAASAGLPVSLSYDSGFQSQHRFENCNDVAVVSEVINDSFNVLVCISSFFMQMLLAS